jgi:uncharacterized protein (DUF885 family)
MLTSHCATQRCVNLLAAAAVAFFSCIATSADAQSTSSSGAEWDAYVEQFLNDYFAANPDAAVAAGRHEFDGKLPDWSDDGLRRELARLKAERAKISSFPSEQLDDHRRFEHDYLLAQIDDRLFWLEVADHPRTSPVFYSNSLDPDVYVRREYAPLETRIKAYTQYARNVPRALEQIQSNLKTPIPKTLVQIGRKTIGGLAGFYAGDVAATFAPVKDEQLQKDFQEANAAAIQAVKKFDAWLATLEPTATDDYALGPDKFSLMLKMTEGVDIPLGRLDEIGKRDLARNLEALEEECKKLAPDKTVEECMAMVAARKAEGNGPVDAASHQLAGLRKFVEDHDLVSIPGTEQARVAQAPAYRAWNFAYIDIPGPYEKGLPSTYYISPPDPTWTKEAQDAYTPGRANLLYTSAHEVYPGHFLQYLHAHRAPSKIGQLFVGYGFSEGWAHYAEEMMHDAGLSAGDPEMHIGQLHDALLRNVRFVAAIGLHTQGMTVDEAKKLFREKSFTDEGNALQQAARGTFDPAYLNYTLGKLMIRKLRDDWTATRRGRAAWKEFHDEFLRYGGPPIPLIRRVMMGPEDKGSLL